MLTIPYHTQLLSYFIQDHFNHGNQHPTVQVQQEQPQGRF